MFFQPRFRLFFFPLFVLGLPSLHSLAESTMCTESEDSRLIRSTEPLTSLRFQFLAFRSIRQQQPANLRTRQKRPYAPFPTFPIFSSRPFSGSPSKKDSVLPFSKIFQRKSIREIVHTDHDPVVVARYFCNVEQNERNKLLENESQLA